jgi:outer membrane receptor protein involved in Fe transport
VIESALAPTYKASNDVVEFNADLAVTPELTFTSQTGYNHDRIASMEDFNRFTTAEGIFASNDVPPPTSTSLLLAPPTPNGEYCDPQLGCSNRLVAQDLSQARSWQMSQEFRLASKFNGPFNFNIGGNYLHYETLEDYYVLINLLTLLTQSVNQNGYSSINHGVGGFAYCGFDNLVQHNYGDAANSTGMCAYVDPNPLSSLDGNGHNYFRSVNPYTVNSYAGFGEASYQIMPDLKLTGGLRWTDDQKHFVDMPSWVVTPGWGYPITGIVNQEWKEFTGRFVATWTPKLSFTDQSLFYGSFSRGYKGGGANPPGPAINEASSTSAYSHPLTFAPEFNNAFELGTKNTLGDGAVTLNADVFYYDYKGYQISEIVDRTSINLNIDAKVKGAEIESIWEPITGLRFNLSAGYETSRIDNGQSSIDLMDRTAGHSDWTIVHPWITATSNCVLPKSTVGAIISNYRSLLGGDDSHPIPAALQAYDVQPLLLACYAAYSLGLDPGLLYGTITGFDPATAPNGGAGFSKELGGNELPNTPHFTLSWGAQYSVPVTSDWAATLRGDFYYQSDSWARIFNDSPYDRLRGYANLNLALILTSQNGWQAMGYMKNVFNTTAITGAFLNSDDTGLTTNVFATDPRLFGIRVTKNW